jgi:hypothetical protein
MHWGMGVSGIKKGFSQVDVKSSETLSQGSL